MSPNLNTTCICTPKRRRIQIWWHELFQFGPSFNQHPCALIWMIRGWELAIKPFSKWRPSVILNLWNLVVWSRDLCLSVILLLCTKFRVNRTIRWDIHVAKNYFQYGGRPPFWICKMLILCHVTILGIKIFLGVTRWETLKALGLKLQDKTSIILHRLQWIDRHYTQTKSVARLKFKRRQPPLASLPSLFLFPSFLPLPSLPLISPPLYQLGGLEERCELPQWVWGEAPAAEQFGAYLSQKEWPWWQHFYGFRIKTSSVFWSK